MTRRQRRRLAIGGAVAVALAIVALVIFGGSDMTATEEEVRDQADAFWTTMTAGDGAAACALATPAGQRELTSVTGGVPKDAGCEEGAEILGRGAGPYPSAEYDGANIRIDGDVATAQTDVGFCMPMKKVDGTWLVDGVPQPFQAGDPPECLP